MSYFSGDDISRFDKWFNILDSIVYQWPNMQLEFTKRIISNVQLSTSRHKPKQCPLKGCITPTMENSYNTLFQNSFFYRHNSDIILVIEFNSPTFHAIPFVDYIYRTAFKNIIYCGPNKPFPRMSNIDFITYTAERKGSLFYTCATMVMQMKFDVKGYILISDDVIMNLHRWSLIDKGRNVLTYADHRGIKLFDTGNMKRCLHNTCTTPPSWVHLNTYKSNIRDLLTKSPY